MSEINIKSPTFDVVAPQGSTFKFQATITDENSAPIDLAGHTVRAQIRKNPSDSKETGIIASYTAIDEPNGVYQIAFSANDMSTLPCGTDENASDSLYYWDCELHYSNGEVDSLFNGSFKLFREVTKEV